MKRWQHTAPVSTKAQRVDAQISNVRLVGVQGEAMSSPFASLNYKPDDTKAYFEFDICYALPSITGPVKSGYLIGYYPDTLAVSHPSLVHQQVNLRHLVKSYDKDNIAQDRIVGCVVATSFPKAPMGGWKMGTDPNAAPCIRGLAVVFKMAHGMNATMGDHLASRKKQSVSIETTTTLANMGLYLPSTGQLAPLVDPPDEWLDALGEPPEGYATPTLGKVDGEQLVLIYGLNGQPISFLGVAMTPNPAERRAKITTMHAESSEGTFSHIAAESVAQVLVGAQLRFRSSGRPGTIVAVHNEGNVRLPGNLWTMKATPDDPVLDIELPDKRHVLHKMTTVADRLTD